MSLFGGKNGMVKKVKIIIRLSAALLIVCATFMFSASCSSLSSDYLFYQNYPINVKGTMTFGNSKYGIELTVTGYNEGSLTFVTPETLNGYRYDIKNNQISMTYGDLTIPLSDTTYQFNPSSGIIQMFSLRPDEMKTASLTEVNGITMNKIEFVHYNNAAENAVDAEHNSADAERPYDVTIWTNSNTNKPVKIICNDITLDISEFTDSNGG
jgi:hypothetical protein